MLALLSPAKSLSFQAYPSELPTSQPRFEKQSSQLLKGLKQLSWQDLAQMMALSDKLAQQNHARYLVFEELAQRPAILTFNGDAYQGLCAEELSLEELMSLNDRLRILSGFYGLLCPLDLIRAYRLEMGRSLAPFCGVSGQNSYTFVNSTN